MEESLLDENNNNSIAIVGMAFRLPGDIHTVDQFWQSLVNKTDLITEIPNARLDRRKYYHPRKSEKGKSYTYGTGSISNTDLFDAKFFGISPREARQMDPRQRMLLELTWEALENGGQLPKALRGSDCGVYVGISGNEYSMAHSDDPAIIDPYSMTGNACSIASNRISYVFDLHGPSMSIDTACSSALVALHQACLSMRKKETSAAVVGCAGVNLHPLAYVGFSKAKMLSEDGRCKPFSETANGYVRSEGAVVLYLKPLSDAIADGDPIQAVILNTGVNSDGHTSSLPVPSCDAQKNLLLNTTQAVGITADDITYVEAHGTGTPVGDPIEAEAIGDALATKRKKQTPLLIGSVKSNLGHLEVSSGMAGLLKVVACLKHRAVPATIHFNKANPDIDFKKLNLKVVDKYTSISKSDKPLIMGVNCFGFGGTNAHVLLAEVPKTSVKKANSKTKNVPPLFLSAQKDDALKEMAISYAKDLNKNPSAYYDVASTVYFRRERLKHVAAFYGDTPEAIISALSEYGKGKVDNVQYVASQCLGTNEPSVFVFSGNGSQWLGMGKSMLQKDGVFRRCVKKISDIFANFRDVSLFELLKSSTDETLYNDTSYAQPLLFAVQMGIVEYYKHLGLTPDAVVGHSVGEVAAACVCGALTLNDAVRVIHERSSKQEKTRGQGKMAAISLGKDELQELLTETGLTDVVDIAGVNSWRGVTVSGDKEHLNTLLQKCNEKSIHGQFLEIDYAFHSQKMLPLKKQFLNDLGELTSNKIDIEFVSTVYGKPCQGEKLNQDYWWRNIADCVQFQAAIDYLIDKGAKIFIEIGPHPVLQSYIKDSLRQHGVQGAVLESFRRHQDGEELLRQSYLKLWANGANVDDSLFFPNASNFVELPNYPWQKESFWVDHTIESQDPLSKQVEHPLLGWRVAIGEPDWENHLDVVMLPYLSDHKVEKAVVMPATGYIEMAQAALALHLEEAQELCDLDILLPLVFEPDSMRSIKVHISVEERSFTVRSTSRLSEEGWVLHAKGYYRRASSYHADKLSISELKRKFKRHIDKREHYRLAGKMGLHYGHAFQGLNTIHLQNDKILAEVDVPSGLSLDGYHLHPALLDICFQSIIGLFQHEINTHTGNTFLPVRVERVKAYSDLKKFSYIFGSIVSKSRRSIVADFKLLDSKGRVLAELFYCRFRRVQLRQHDALPQMYRYESRLSLPHTESKFVNIDDLSDVASNVLSQFADKNKVHFETVSPLFDTLVSRYIFDALSPLVSDKTPETLTEFVKRNKITEESRSLLQRLFDILKEDGVIELDALNRIVWRGERFELPEAEVIWLAILGDYPGYTSELVRLGRCGKYLQDILLGKTIAKDIFDDKDASGVNDHLAQNSPSVVYVHHMMSELLRHFVQNKRPSNRRLKILDIGAKRGGVSQQFLEALPLENIDYWLCDEDELQLAKATAICGGFTNVETKRFYPDASLDEQSDFKNERFDIVIVANGVHHLDNVDAVLRNIKTLLKIDGVLLFKERFSDRYSDITFGLNPEWWIYSDDEKVVPRLRSKTVWQKKLRDAGFIFIDSLKEPGANDNEGAFIFLAQTLEPAESLEQLSERAYLLISDNPSSVKSLQKSLLENDHKVSVASSKLESDFYFSLDDPESIKQFAFKLSQTRVADEIVIFPKLDLQKDSPLSVKPWCDFLIELTKVFNDNLPERISIITRGAVSCHSENVTLDYQASASILWGFVRVLMNEHPELNFKLIDLQFKHTSKTGEVLSKELSVMDGEDEVFLTHDARYCLRLVPHTFTSEKDARESEDVKLDFEEAGPLKNLKWYPQSYDSLDDDEVLVQPKASGLNFRDVMYAMRLISDEAVENGFLGATLGMEFAGDIVACGANVSSCQVGDKVMGFAPSSLSSLTKTKASAVSSLPDHWSYEEAATVPTAFFTAYYALRDLAQISAGETILVHGAAGGVGIAAIQLAHYFDVNIIATAGTDEKRDLLRMMGIEHVFDSRQNAFADEVLAVTNGKGVDVILNSLAGEAIDLNLSVLKPFGRFLELGKRDFYANSKIGLRPFRNNISYFGIDADQLMVERPKLTERLFNDVMGLFKEGVLRPLPFRVFSAAHAADAFRYMQQSKQIGKIVLSFQHKPQVTASFEHQQATLTLSDNAYYLVTGGLSGFGLKTALWLAKKGAKHLLLISRRGVVTDEANLGVEQLEEQGINVKVASVDVCDKAALKTSIDALDKPLKGVFHCAAIFDDVYIKDMTHEQLQRVLEPKALGAHYLHELTATMQLDYFVMYSSGTTLFGNPGQANYVAANCYLESLVYQRRSQGLSAHYVAWGAIDDVGYLTRNEKVKEFMQSSLGVSTLQSDEALNALELILVDSAPGVAVMELNARHFLKMLPTSDKPKFNMLQASLSKDDDETVEDIRAQIQGKSLNEVEDMIVDILRHEIADILCLPADSIPSDQSIANLGMDSLMGVELVRAIEQRFAITIPMMILSQGPTVRKISRQVAMQLCSTEKDSSDDDSNISTFMTAASQHAEDFTLEEVQAVAIEVEKETQAKQQESVSNE